ncbi:uncharacterized protein PHALS_01064 [Plasmopara halstedii]|uniref:Uncharacterized protein n=1 Tax=Plasmopara halstedii TaxID=4781 RepID=A0A0P1ATD1_PLAHL|nr:uncharacterized protein PHALS_01064 [Plasmopara halstedii]CEG44722.1 hypothetical protein PHALS_01064 [Plasmopara halstedii]|eukprot:XP_024581091.1 hypothetical protein PHALS_01064 [Plasmopara halstedii]
MALQYKKTDRGAHEARFLGLRALRSSSYPHPAPFDTFYEDRRGVEPNQQRLFRIARDDL